MQKYIWTQFIGKRSLVYGHKEKRARKLLNVPTFGHKSESQNFIMDIKDSFGYGSCIGHEQFRIMDTT